MRSSKGLISRCVVFQRNANRLSFLNIEHVLPKMRVEVILLLPGSAILG